MNVCMHNCKEQWQNIGFFFFGGGGGALPGELRKAVPLQGQTPLCHQNYEKKIILITSF